MVINKQLISNSSKTSIKLNQMIRVYHLPQNCIDIDLCLNSMPMISTNRSVIFAFKKIQRSGHEK